MRSPFDMRIEGWGGEGREGKLLLMGQDYPNNGQVNGGPTECILMQL